VRRNSETGVKFCASMFLKHLWNSRVQRKWNKLSDPHHSIWNDLHFNK
jgi:hypothetical protein